MRTECIDWAREQFGHAELGDPRRTERLVTLAAEAAEHPAGTVTRVCRGSAEREGAFRWLESERVDTDAVAEAHHRASAAACAGHEQVVVAVDQTSLTVTDRQRAKGLGPVGHGLEHVRELQVMNALALEPDGTPVGLCAQQWWIRSGHKKPTWKHDKRPLEQRESVLWRDTLRSARTHFAEQAPQTEPWFQLDAGADIWHVLQLAADEGLTLTVRSAYDRSLSSGPDGEPTRLHERLAQAPLQGEVKLQVPRRPAQRGRPAQPARTALLQVRACRVPLRLRDYKREVGKVWMRAVLVTEPAPPRGVEPLRWLLLSTEPVDDFDDAMRIVHAYTLRWRIEDLHRCWKSGRCNIERSQLRSANALRRWAIVLGAVASRIERLKHLSRTDPERPALEELSRAEVDAAILLAPDHDHEPGAELSLARVVELIARVGGYTGKSSGGPPGATTIGRGLDEVGAGARAITALRKRGTG